MLLDIPAVANTEGAVENKTWVESGQYQPSATVYTDAEKAKFFVYIDEPSAAPYIMRAGHDFAYTYNADGSVTTITFIRRVPQGSTIKFLTCVASTFTVPAWCRSFTLQNISGADMFYRRYAPNVEANVIDTSAVTFGEDGIVGQRLINGQTACFSNGDFTPGASFMLCATAAASNGAIVNFAP